MKKSIVIILIFIGIILAWAIIYYATRTIQTPMKDDINIEQNQNNINISNWQTYRNEEYGFELKYPADFTKQKTGSDDNLLYLRRTEGESDIFININLKKNFQINKTISNLEEKEIKIGDRLGYRYFFHEGVGYTGVVLIQLDQDALELTYDFIGGNKYKEIFVRDNLNKIISTMRFI